MCVVTKVYPLGMRTRLPLWTTATLLSHVQVAGRKWLVQPESATANSTGGVNSVQLNCFFNELLRLTTAKLPLLCHFWDSAPPCMSCLVAVYTCPVAGAEHFAPLCLYPGPHVQQ